VWHRAIRARRPEIVLSFAHVAPVKSKAPQPPPRQSSPLSAPRLPRDPARGLGGRASLHATGTLCALFTTSTLDLSRLSRCIYTSPGYQCRDVLMIRGTSNSSSACDERAALSTPFALLFATNIFTLSNARATRDANAAIDARDCAVFCRGRTPRARARTTRTTGRRRAQCRRCWRELRGSCGLYWCLRRSEYRSRG